MSAWRARIASPSKMRAAPTAWRENLRFQARWRLHGLRRRFAKRAYQRDRRLRFDVDLVLWARLSEFAGARIYVYGTTEYFSTSLFKTLLSPGATVIDIGANVGEYTLIAAKYVGPTGTVLAFEPLPMNFTLLKKSVDDNGFDNVVLSQLALSNKDGDAMLRVPGGSNAGVASLAAATETASSILVHCARLDTVLDENALGRVDVIKLDVEGFEPEVIEGAARTLEHDRPWLLFEVNGLMRSRDGVNARSIDSLRSFGYDMYGVEALGGPRWRLVHVHVGEDPSRFRDRWETDAFPPNLLAAHPANPRTQVILKRLSQTQAQPNRKRE